MPLVRKHPNFYSGSMLCDPAQPIPSTPRLRARIVIFNIEVPITKGFPVRLLVPFISLSWEMLKY